MTSAGTASRVSESVVNDASSGLDLIERVAAHVAAIYPDLTSQQHIDIASQSVAAFGIVDPNRPPGRPRYSADEVVVITYGDTIIDSRGCLLYTSPSPRDQRGSRMPSSA